MKNVWILTTTVFTLTVAVGVEDRPAEAPLSAEPFKSNYVLFGNPKPAEALAAISSIVFAYAGTPAFFNIAAEMREPRLYTRALIVCQSVMTGVYLTIGIVVYYFCGSYVASPALGSAGKSMKKVCYGLALPGLIVSTTLFIHVSYSNPSNSLANGHSLAQNTSSCDFFVAQSIWHAIH